MRNALEHQNTIAPLATTMLSPRDGSPGTATYKHSARSRWVQNKSCQKT